MHPAETPDFMRYADGPCLRCKGVHSEQCPEKSPTLAHIDSDALTEALLGQLRKLLVEQSFAKFERNLSHLEGKQEAMLGALVVRLGPVSAGPGGARLSGQASYTVKTFVTLSGVQLPTDKERERLERDMTARLPKQLRDSQQRWAPLEFVHVESAVLKQQPPPWLREKHSCIHRGFVYMTRNVLGEEFPVALKHRQQELPVEGLDLKKLGKCAAPKLLLAALDFARSQGRQIVHMSLAEGWWRADQLPRRESQNRRRTTRDLAASCSTCEVLLPQMLCVATSRDSRTVEDRFRKSLIGSSKEIEAWRKQVGGSQS